MSKEIIRSFDDSMWDADILLNVFENDFRISFQPITVRKGGKVSELNLKVKTFIILSFLASKLWVRHYLHLFPTFA